MGPGMFGHFHWSLCHLLEGAEIEHSFKKYKEVRELLLR